MTALSHTHQAFLTDVFARNRVLYGGFVMEDDSAKSDDSGKEAKAEDKADASKSKDSDASGGDEPLGEAGARALRAEREARKTLETELSNLKKGLASALGVADESGKDDGADAVARVQQQIADMQRENRILALANKHQITDEVDLEILSSAKDEESMKRLAERLAPAKDEGDATSRRPKPDRSQGGGETRSGKTGGGGSVAEVMAERRAAREASKSNSN